MTFERKIPWSQQLGEIGESAITSVLAHFSNPMKPTFDVGIDFWCELIEDGYPSHKFFLVQAKGTQHFDEKWGRSFDKDVIFSWLRQPFPLYIIVYDDVSKDCYWMSIEENRKNLIERIQNDETKTVHLAIDRKRILRADKSDEFVNRIKADLDSISFRQNLIRGVPYFIGEGYVRTIPIIYLPDELIANIRERIRMSINYIVYNYLFRSDLTNAYLLCEFLTEFDKGHYDHFVLLGNICKSLGKTKEACSSFRQAIEICQKDENWNKLKKPSDPSIEDIISSIKEEMSNLGCETL